MILNASLDTSFWTCASPIGVIPYLFEFFRVHYCTSVEQEIVTTNPQETALVYPQAQLFLVLQEDERLHRLETQKPISRFGAGEAHAIALALEYDWVLLINDRRPRAFAKALGIQAISVPAFCVFLYANGKITRGAVDGCLKRLIPATSPMLINEAKATLTYLDGPEKE